MSNGAWANGVFIQAALMDVEFQIDLSHYQDILFMIFIPQKDEKKFALGMINSRIEWPKLADILDRKDWIDRELFDFEKSF